MNKFWRLGPKIYSVVILLSAFTAGPRPARIALVVGTEGGGLSAAVEAGADCRIRIEMRPGVDSLNVAVAAGIALHALQ